jgi:hypothetical protein
MNLGELLGGAGVVGQSWRAEEEAQRVARQNQLAIEEQNRLAGLKAQMAQTQLAAFQPAAVPQFPVGVAPGAKMSFPEAAPTAPAAPATPAAAPVAPTAPAAARPVTPPAPAAGLQTPQAETPFGRWWEAQGQKGRELQDRERLRTQIIEQVGPRAGLFGVFQKQTAQEREAAKQVMDRLDKLSTEEMLYVLSTGRLPVAVPTAAPAAPTAAPTTASTQLTQAMIQVESGGRPGAVSPKGAVGLMQVMPATAMNPGFGLPNVFDFAQQMGTQVGKRNEAEAKRLLADPAIGRAYGEQYMGAMLQKYNGNTELALAAYNAGPKQIDDWLAAGADPAKLPKETQAYVPKVMAAMGGVAGAGAAGMTPAPLEVPKTQARNMEMAEFYLAQPESIPYEQQQLRQVAQQQAALLTQQRNETARLAQIYMQSGTAQGIEAAMRLRGDIMQADAQLLQIQQQVAEKETYLQGMQGLRELAVANDPRRLAGVLSTYMGAPVGIQPRPDGNYNYFVNGKKVQDNVSPAQLAGMALKEFSPEARAASAKSAALENELALKRKYGDVVVNAMRDIQKAMVEGEYKLAEKRAEQAQGKFTPLGDGSGRGVFQQGNRVLVISPDGKVEEIGGVKVETGPTARQVAGLNMGR